MKPFNLERALAGDPVCTRNGMKVKIGGHYSESHPRHRVIGWLDDGRCCSWCDDGTYWTYARTGAHQYDLFMAPIKRKMTGWVNVYPFVKGSSGCYWYGYNNKESADRDADLERRLACVEVTVEIDEDEWLAMPSYIERE